MSEQPRTIQQQLEAEQAVINALTDTTEAALRGNALKCKISALKGESGAGDALVKAQKALDDYLAARDTDGWFRSAREAGQWLSGQGYISNRGNAIVPDVARKLVETLKKDPKRGYSRRLVIQSADMKWGKPGGRIDNDRPPIQEEIDKAREQARIAKETADKLAFKNEIDRKNYLPVADETRRRVQVIVGMKIALENQRTTFMQILSERMRASAPLSLPNDGDGALSGVGSLSGVEVLEWQRQAIDALVLEAGHIYSNAVLQVFAEIGKQGGVEV